MRGYFLHGRPLLERAWRAVPPMSGQDRKAGGSAEDEEVQAASAGLPRQLYGVGDTGRLAQRIDLEQWCCSKSCLMMSVESCLEMIRTTQAAGDALEQGDRHET